MKIGGQIKLKMAHYVNELSVCFEMNEFTLTYVWMWKETDRNKMSEKIERKKKKIQNG